MTTHRVSRREFLRVATLAATTAAIPACATTTPSPASGATRNSDPGAGDAGLKLGVASYSLRNFSRQQAIEMTR